MFIQKEIMPSRRVDMEMARDHATVHFSMVSSAYVAGDDAAVRAWVAMHV